MKKLLSVVAGFTFLFMGQAFAENAYDFSFAGEDGKTYSLSEYKGKVLVVMNTATKCGFAPQYSGMQKLLDKYGEDKLAVSLEFHQIASITKNLCPMMKYGRFALTGLALNIP